MSQIIWHDLHTTDFIKFSRVNGSGSFGLNIHFYGRNSGIFAGDVGMRGGGWGGGGIRFRDENTVRHIPDNVTSLKRKTTTTAHAIQRTTRNVTACD